MRLARRCLIVVACAMVVAIGLSWATSGRWHWTVGYDAPIGRQAFVVQDRGWSRREVLRRDLGASGNRLSLTSHHGRLVVTRWRPGSQLPPTASRGWPGVTVSRSGWGDGTGQLGAADNVAVAHWLVALPFALVCLIPAARTLRRRPKPGHCPTCGYDLRASPDRCPECGLAASAP